MALPSGMQLVRALDDSNYSPLLPIDGEKTSGSTRSVQRTILLPLECQETLDTDMDIDVDVFRPSAMLDPQLSDAFGESNELLLGTPYQSELVDAEEDIEQMLLYGSEEALAVQNHHQHQTAPGQGCQCRIFAIKASHVQAHQEGVVVESMAAKNQKRVLRHTFGSGKRLPGFGFENKVVLDQTQRQDVAMDDGHLTLMIDSGLQSQELQLEGFDRQSTRKIMEPVLVPQEEEGTFSSEYISRSLIKNQGFDSPLASHPLSAVSSPLSATSFVSLESMMATPLSTTSRGSAQLEIPLIMRSLSPADELEKMAINNSKTSMTKLNMLKGNFQVSQGHECVPLVKPTAMLPPPYLRGALDSPEKRRAHSKTFNSFAQSLSFSFSNKTSTNR
ncbi:hypothetical protein Plhal304r1_c031g0100011 [Plasmopara halstedii]